MPLGVIATVSIHSHPNFSETSLVKVKFTAGQVKQSCRKPVVRKNRVFIPLSPTQAKQIERLSRTRKGNWLGFATLLKRRRENNLEWIEFYPTGRRAIENITRLGIGTRVHHGVTELLAKKFKRYSIEHDATLSAAHKAQLRAMGIKHSTRYPVEQYAEIVRRYAAKKFGRSFGKR